MTLRDRPRLRSKRSTVRTSFRSILLGEDLPDFREASKIAFTSEESDGHLGSRGVDRKIKMLCVRPNRADVVASGEKQRHWIESRS